MNAYPIISLHLNQKVSLSYSRHLVTASGLIIPRILECERVCVFMRGHTHLFSVAFLFLVPQYLNTLHFYSSGSPNPNTGTHFMISGQPVDNVWTER
jgi:hypothetical protein